MMNILFFLPGSALPEASWFAKVYLDKWVHIGLFGGFFFLWRSTFDWDASYYNRLLVGCAIVYGFLIEVIQYEWIPNRSFDLYDVVADTAGCIIGLMVWHSTYRKK